MKGEKMFLKSKWFQLGVAVAICLVVLLLPRPEGIRFTIKGDGNHVFLGHIKDNFKLINSVNNPTEDYIVEVKSPQAFKYPGKYLGQTAEKLKLKDLRIDYVDGLSPKAKRFLAVLAVLVFLFIFEPIPLEITAICIGVFLVVMGISDVKDAWSPYMHPVVVFVMSCLIFAIALGQGRAHQTIRVFYPQEGRQPASCGLHLSSASVWVMHPLLCTMPPPLPSAS